MNGKLGMVYRYEDGIIETETRDSVTGRCIIDEMVDRYGWEMFTDTDMVMALGPNGAYAAAYDLSSHMGRLRYSANCRDTANR